MTTAKQFFRRKPEVLCGLVCAIAAGLNGCVTKARADMQARLAFMAGQQQAMMQQQQAQRQQMTVYRGPSVTFIGPVQNFVVPWRDGLTLAQAIVSAQYTGNGNPSAITIHRAGQDIAVDPKQLLNGEDFPLQVGDVVELQQAGYQQQ